MKKLFVIITIPILSGCHVTGHNKNGDRAVFNGLNILSIYIPNLLKGNYL
jgi:hypothetical protein